MNELRSLTGSEPDLCSQKMNKGSLMVERSAPLLTARDWIEAMVDRYERPLLAYACRLFGGDHAKSQDAVQETFLRLTSSRELRLGCFRFVEVASSICKGPRGMP